MFIHHLVYLQPIDVDAESSFEDMTSKEVDELFASSPSSEPDPIHKSRSSSKRKSKRSIFPATPPKKDARAKRREEQSKQWKLLKARVSMAVRSDLNTRSPDHLAKHYKFVRDVSQVYFQTMTKGDDLHIERFDTCQSAIMQVFAGNKEAHWLVHARSFTNIILCINTYHPTH